MSRLKRMLVLPWLLGASLALANTTTRPATPTLKAGVLSPVMAAPALMLQGTDGRPLELARYQGKVVLLAFGFSSCGEVCPITLATLAGARKKLGADADRVQVVYVTVDPERDDAARMKNYLEAFDPSFIGGVGTRAQIDAAQKSYGISSKKITFEGGGYTIGHSSSVYMIDRKGGLHAVMPYGRSVDDFVHDLKILLRT